MSELLSDAVLGLIALCMLVGVWLVFRASPRLVMAVWAGVLYFVPVWFGVQAGAYLSALVIVSLLGIAAGSLEGLRWSVVDSLMLAFVLLLLVTQLGGGATWGHLLIILVDWMIPYVWGRVVLARVPASWVYATLATGAVAIAAVALVEFATGSNLFVGLAMPNATYRAWDGLQLRGGVVRAEASFGHSIALGSSLAIASVFVAATRWPGWLRILSLAVLLAGAGVTFSRLGIGGMVLSLVLAVVFLGRWLSRGVRVAVLVLLAAVAAIGLPLIGDVFSSAGEEAEGSAEYRGDLVNLLGDFAILGITPSWSLLPNGDTYYGSFQSIDNALILTGLRYGLVPVLLLITALAIAVLSLFRGRATPAAVAVVGQIPAFATVALITQYAGFVWFTAGLAVASYSLNRIRHPSDEDGGLHARPIVEREGVK